MAARLRELFPERSPVHALGAELRRLRLDRGLSQARLGQQIGYSPTLIGKIEKAERLPTADFCARADTALQTGGRLSRMWPTVSPHTTGVPVELVHSPWTAPTSLRLLRDLITPPRHHDFVLLTRATLDVVHTAWTTTAPAAGPTEPSEPSERAPGAPFGAPPAPAPARPGSRASAGPPLDLRVLNLVAARLSGLNALHELSGGDALDVVLPDVLDDLASVELRCLTELITRSALPTIAHRRLLGLTARAAQLCGRLRHDPTEPKVAQRFHLVALRCAADAGARALGAEIFAELRQVSPVIDDPITSDHATDPVSDPASNPASDPPDGPGVPNGRKADHL